MQCEYMMRSRAINTVFYCLLIFGAFGSQASARHHPYKAENRQIYATKGIQTSKPTSALGPKPAAWCGWWMRSQKGGGPEFNVARNWAKRGQPLNAPEVGAVVVWTHHVGIITAKATGKKWVVKSGNDSNRVRERARTVHDAIAFRRV